MQKSNSSIWRSCWLYMITAGVFLAVFAAYPQIKLNYNSETPTNGHYAYNDIDEVAYASYLKALIDGRPRKNDPYTGRDESAATPQPESLFSIQFAAPYTVALPARVLSISAPTAMTLAGIIAGFLAAVIAFWLIYLAFEDKPLAFAGSLFVLCGGALLAGEGAFGEITGTGFSYPYFPFLRRYVPAVPFPVMLFMFAAVWKMLTTSENKRRIGWCIAASAAFSFLVFSYFYIWTAAAAWLLCVFVVLLLVRPDDWKKLIAGMIALGVSCLVPLAFYGYMLSMRANSMDNVQLLVRSHAPDLARVPLYVGVCAIVISLLFALSKKNGIKSMAFVLTAATGTVPLLLFNQQIITGISLQPIHYQVFVGNYIAGLAFVMAVGLLLKELTQRQTGYAHGALFFVAVVSVAWGFVECHYTVRVLDGANLARDRAYKVGEFLTNEAKKSNDPYRDTILTFSSLHGDDSPTVAPQNVLWTRHQHVFAGLTWKESKERYFRQIYFEGRSPEWLDVQLKNGNYVAMIALFGWGRHSDRLTTESKPLSYREVDEVVTKFKTFADGFDKKDASQPLLRYLVVPVSAGTEFPNVDKWYEKTKLTGIDGYDVYGLKLRDEESFVGRTSSLTGEQLR